MWTRIKCGWEKGSEKIVFKVKHLILHINLFLKGQMSVCKQNKLLISDDRKSTDKVNTWVNWRNGMKTGTWVE